MLTQICRQMASLDHYELTSMTADNNILRREQNFHRWYFQMHLERILLHFTKISLNFASQGLIDDNSAFLQVMAIMAWCQTSLKWKGSKKTVYLHLSAVYCLGESLQRWVIALAQVLNKSWKEQWGACMYHLDGHETHIMSLKAVKLTWIFPGAPLTFNGAPGNIQGKFDRHAAHVQSRSGGGLNTRMLSYQYKILIIKIRSMG